MNNPIITLLTTLISVCAGIIAAITTTILKTTFDKEIHRSNKYYEYSATAIKEIYEQAKQLEIAISTITKNTVIDVDSLNTAIIEGNKFHSVWSNNEIYLEEAIIEKLKRMDRLFTHVIRGINKINKQYSNHEEYKSAIKSKLEEFDNLLESKIPLIRDEIKTEFKKLLMK